MTWFRSSFEWAGDLYARWFADWLHVDFLIRTAILLLMMWLVIFVAALIFKYLLGPLVVMVYVNIIKRAWNFFFIETGQEWIYINYYSKGDPKFSNMYMRLCDKAKHNRAALSAAGYSSILRRGRVRKLGNSMMIAVGIIVTLWVGAFGLNQEYVMPAWGAGVTPEVNDNNEPEDYEIDEPTDDENDEDNEQENNEESPTNIYTPGQISPGLFPQGEHIIFSLTEEAGSEGARLRDGPGTDTTVIEMVFGYDLLVYLGYYVPDAGVDTLYWLRVRTSSGTEGYIASQLVEVVG